MEDSNESLGTQLVGYPPQGFTGFYQLNKFIMGPMLSSTSKILYFGHFTPVKPISWYINQIVYYVLSGKLLWQIRIFSPSIPVESPNKSYT